jgi:hypothetical protein
LLCNLPGAACWVNRERPQPGRVGASGRQRDESQEDIWYGVKDLRDGVQEMTLGGLYHNPVVCGFVHF